MIGSSEGNYKQVRCQSVIGIIFDDDDGKTGMLFMNQKIFDLKTPEVRHWVSSFTERHLPPTK